MSIEINVFCRELGIVKVFLLKSIEKKTKTKEKRNKNPINNF